MFSHQCSLQSAQEHRLAKCTLLLLLNPLPIRHPFPFASGRPHPVFSGPWKPGALGGRGAQRQARPQPHCRQGASGLLQVRFCPQTSERTAEPGRLGTRGAGQAGGPVTLALEGSIPSFILEAPPSPLLSRPVCPCHWETETAAQPRRFFSLPPQVQTAANPHGFIFKTPRHLPIALPASATWSALTSSAPSLLFWPTPTCHSLLKQRAAHCPPAQGLRTLASLVQEKLES